MTTAEDIQETIVTAETGTLEETTETVIDAPYEALPSGSDDDVLCIPENSYETTDYTAYEDYGYTEELAQELSWADAGDYTETWTEPETVPEPEHWALSSEKYPDITWYDRNGDVESDRLVLSEIEQALADVKETFFLYSNWYEEGKNDWICIYPFTTPEGYSLYHILDKDEADRLLNDDQYQNTIYKVWTYLTSNGQSWYQEVYFEVAETWAAEDSLYIHVWYLGDFVVAKDMWYGQYEQYTLQPADIPEDQSTEEIIEEDPEENPVPAEEIVTEEMNEIIIQEPETLTSPEDPGQDETTQASESVSETTEEPADSASNIYTEEETTAGPEQSEGSYETTETTAETDTNYIEETAAEELTPNDIPKGVLETEPETEEDTASAETEESTTFAEEPEIEETGSEAQTEEEVSDFGPEPGDGPADAEPAPLDADLMGKDQTEENTEEPAADTVEDAEVSEEYPETGDVSETESGGTGEGPDPDTNETEEDTQEEETSEEEDSEEYSVTSYKYEDDYVKVTAELQYASAIPDNARLSVIPVCADTEGYDYEACMALLNEQSEAQSYTERNTVLYDISFLVPVYDEDGKIISEESCEPADGTVKISIEFKQNQLSNGLNVLKEEQVEVIHLVSEDAETVDNSDLQPARAENVEAAVNVSDTENIEFITESFSIYAISYQIGTCLITADGQNYEITAVYGQETGIPEDASLDVREILSEEEEYDTYRYMLEEKPEIDVPDNATVRFFDITILDHDGQPVQPLEGTSVEMQVDLVVGTGEERSSVTVAHFGASIDVIEDAEAEGTLVSFGATSFSVYAIIDAPAPYSANATTVQTLTELADNLNEGFYISEKRTGKHEYAASTLNSNNCFNLVNNYSAAAVWYFEPVEGQQNQYYIYTMDGNTVKYMYNHSGNLMSLSETDKTAFELTQEPAGQFLFKKVGENKWLQYSGSGKGLRLYTDANNKANARITLTYESSVNIPDDYYNLDGKTYGIIYHNKDISGSYMSSEAQTAKKLKAGNITVRPDIISLEGLLMVSSETEITDWTFHSLGSDKYYMTTETEDGTKYLACSNSGLYLADEFTAANSTVVIKSGTGDYAGKYTMTINGMTITQSGGSQVNGFSVASTATQYSWMNFVLKDDSLTNEDFVIHTAGKVNLSDPAQVPNGQKVIIYTRIWNDSKKEYEFYTIDYNGTLVRCYERGDTIEWVGSQVNTKLWTFTEYYYENGTPNYYYELQNDYSGKYLAPQITGDQVLSDNKIGINLNGRRYGDDYTTIIAWDEVAYAYASLHTQDKHDIVVGSLAKAEDFYFAIMEDPTDELELTTVETVDNDLYGITLKMIDYNNPIVNYRDSLQTQILGSGFMEDATAGLLEANMTGDYPMTDPAYTKKPQASLETLYTGTTDVNHLFIQSVYDSSGYFEFDSTQNYAYLGDNTNFTVYNQLGTINGGSSLSLFHGQFMPYNDLINPETGEPWPYSPTRTNMTTTLNETLPDSDPRKGEQMHEFPVGVADYFFGMEMEASFTQTVSGLDAWGHDIIFEFSGDDDMWLYVDGNLVLDLGGVHSAMSGSINFRTGVVKSSRGNSTLYDIFRSNYIELHPDATETEINTYLNGIFDLNEDGQYIFHDYTVHTMKMFYMERGSGASNLHMRFNLTAVKPGTVVLGKDISGTTRTDYEFAEFPYEVWYDPDGSGNYQLLVQDEFNPVAVYTDTNIPARFESYFVPAGHVDGYDDVFILKPGQRITITLPDGTANYYIKECGINPQIYDEVKMNQIVLTGEDPDQDGIYDYPTDPATMADQPRVIYDNHVNPAMIRTLTITKKLYAEDGTTLLTYEDDQTTFDFRLYLGTINENADDLNPAYMQKYYVKDEHGYYCIYDRTLGKFVSTGVQLFENLTTAQQEAAVCVSSPNGSISRIPAGYSVEIRELLVNTRFKVVERENEIPDGYKLREYYRVAGTYIVEDGDTLNSGIIRDNSNPVIEVHNQRGFGLTVNKVWSDSDYVVWHDDVYFAVYLDGATSPIPGTIRRMSSPNTSLYYYFDALESGYTFDQYKIREVTVENPTVDENGYVTHCDSITTIPNNTFTSVASKSSAEAEAETHQYNVEYIQGTATGNSDLMNVRTDTVTNTRSGLRIWKTAWDGTALANAVFTLTDSLGNNVGAAQYTSDGTGYVTTAYLQDGTYYLTETSAPSGYQHLSNPVEIQVVNGVVSVTTASADSEFVTTDLNPSASMPSITVKNKPYTLKAVKTGNDDVPLANAVFSIYKQVTGANGQPRKDYVPLAGYSQLISDADGIIHEHLETLPAGTYYLCEKTAPTGYALLDYDICFTITASGVVSVENGSSHSFTTDAQAGRTDYTITVRDSSTASLTVEKTVTGSMGNKAKAFEFILSVPGNTATITYTKDGEQDTVVFTNNEYHFWLSHGEQIKFEGFLGEQAYTVTEVRANMDGYTTTITGSASGTMMGDEIVSFENSREVAVPTDLFDLDGNKVLYILAGTAMIVGVILMIRKHKKRKHKA